MSDLTELDRTTIRTYRGDNFAGHLHDYLKSQGIPVVQVGIINGEIWTATENTAYHMPLGAMWWKIAKRMKEIK